MYDGGTNCGKGGTTMADGLGDHWWHSVWSGRTTCGADNLRRETLFRAGRYRLQYLISVRSQRVWHSLIGLKIFDT